MSNETIQKNAEHKGYWEDAKGNLIPVARIKDIDKKRDSLVTDLCMLAKKHSEVLRDFKLETMTDIAEFAQISADEYGATLRGAAGKGNVTLLTFDGRYKVQRATAETIAFDERLQVAQALISECIHVWSKGSNKNIQALVNQAFQTDQEGKVSAGRVLALRKLDIDDPKWLQAMNAIADSMRVSSSKSYVRFYERNDATGDYLPISLDVAAV